MYIDPSLPNDVRRLVDGESVQFAFPVSRTAPMSLGLGLMAFGIVFAAIPTGMLYLLLAQLFSHGSVQVVVNKVPHVATFQDLSPLYVPLGFLTIFLIVALVMMLFGLKQALPRRHWVLVTDKGVTLAGDATVISKPWSSFTGGLKVTGGITKGTLALTEKTGRLVGKHNRYVPDTTWLIGVPKPHEIAAYVRERITP